MHICLQTKENHPPIYTCILHHMCFIALSYVAMAMTVHCAHETAKTVIQNAKSNSKDIQIDKD